MSATRGAGVANRRCTARTPLSTSGFSWALRRQAELGLEGVLAGQGGVAGVEESVPAAEDQGGDRPGVIPPDLAGRSGDELQGADHAVEDGLGTFGGLAR